MNHIATTELLNPFTGRFYAIILVDGTPLEDWLDHHYPNLGMQYLVPTLLTWLDDPEERRVVWSRISSLGEKPVVVPLLMCSEDAEVDCLLVVVEMAQIAESVTWSRIGLDWSDENKMSNSVGTTVDWLEDFQGFEFALEEHQSVVQHFSRLVYEKELEESSDGASQRF